MTEGNHVWIIDDDRSIRWVLEKALQKAGMQVTSFPSAEGVLEELKLAQPDTIVSDIRMPGMDGIETAHHMNRLSKPPAIIFTTAFSEHALKAFETHAVDYLLKPIKQERLHEALDAAARLTKPQLEQLKYIDEQPKVRTHICVKTRGSLELVPIETIRYFLADHKYVTLRTDDHECLIEESLKSLESEFGHLFTRIHRNALIADKYMNGLEKNSEGHCVITIEGIEERLEISRRHLPHVRKKIKNMATFK